MGQAKRRKAALGSAYGTPEGSNWKGQKHWMRAHEFESVKIQIVARCNWEDNPREGQEIMIDLGKLDHPGLVQDELYEFAELIEYPSDKNEGIPDCSNYYHFDVVKTCGLGPRLTALVSDIEGPILGALEDLVCALLNLPKFLWVAFFKWAESEKGNWWLPGYGVHQPEDAVLLFWSSCSSKNLRGWEPNTESTT